MMWNAALSGGSYSVLLGILISLAVVGAAHGARPVGTLETIDAQVLADSAEDLGSRIYSYDMAVDSANDVHVVYSRPFTATSDQIIYARRVKGLWTQHILSSSGLRSSISTEIEVDAAGTVHICYIRSDERLYYRQIQGGLVPGVERFVGNGAWTTRMQLDRNGLPVFIRENESWPSLQSKLVLLTTSNGTSWTSRDVGVPAVPKFRIADFVYRDGAFNVTYGDGSITRQVLAGKGSTTYRTGIFHKLYHARSPDGARWVPTLVDDSGTLFEDEFWTALAVDDAKVVGAFYRYDEFGDEYNTGTSLSWFELTDQGLVKQEITRADYEDTREGMGIALLVNAPGEYLGVWDYSPDDTLDPYFRGERGNIALARNGSDGQWREKLQVDGFSAEGKLLLKRVNGSLHILVLGDYVDTKLYYRELDLAYVNEQFDAFSGGFPWNIFLPAITGAVN